MNSRYSCSSNRLQGIITPSSWEEFFYHLPLLATDLALCIRSHHAQSEEQLSGTSSNRWQVVYLIVPSKIGHSGFNTVTVAGALAEEFATALAILRCSRIRRHRGKHVDVDIGRSLS